MNVLILGGMSPRHKEWIREVADALFPHFEEVRLLDYRHWDNPGTEMDLEYEITQAAQLAKGLSEFVVVAKSIGSVLTVLANERGLFAPRRCVFAGFPLRVVLGGIPEVAAALPKLPPTIFIHNEQDPLGSADSVKEFIEAHQPATYKFKSLQGNTHDYTDFGLIAQLTAVED